MKLKLDIIIFAAALLAVALLADAWRSARHDSQQLAATLAAQNTVIQQAGDHEKQRDAQLATALATIQTQKRSVQTPQQAAQQLASVLPPLPLPVSIHDPTLSTPLPPGEAPPTSISIPQPDLVPLYDDLQDCRANAIQNDSLTKDLSDEKNGPRRSCKNETPPLMSRTAEHFWCVSSEPLNGSPLASPLEPPLPQSPISSPLFRTPKLSLLVRHATPDLAYSRCGPRDP